MDIKERIELVISRHDLTKSELAERMDKMKQNINSLLSDPKWSTIEAVAAALEIPVEELLFDREQIQIVQEKGIILCPKCHSPLRVNIETIETI